MAYVIIPAYKPDRTLISLTEQMWDTGCKVVVVDDGSGEEYQEIFEAINDICVILHHPENKGKGEAIKSGLTYIQEKRTHRDVVGVMDADGQHLPEDMLKLLEAAEEQGNTLVLGVRNVGQKMPLRSRLGNKITRTVFHLVSGVYVSDTQTGLRAFGTELIPAFLEIKGDRYEYEMNVLMTAARKKIHIEEIRIKTIYRDEDNSTSHFRGVQDSFRIYKEIFKFMLSSFSGFVVDYLLFWSCLLIFPHTEAMILTANILARLVSSFFNYSLNCTFVFGTKRELRTAVDYFALAGCILVLNNLFLTGYTQIGHLSPYMAKLLTECTLFLISITVQRCVIFRKKNLLPEVRKEAGL